MLRHSFRGAIVVATLACLLIQDAHGAPCKRCRPTIVSYLFGGYGAGPFGYGEVYYNGSYSVTNLTNLRQRHR